jgi:molecular chaperone DnaK (HSP70)
LEGDLNKVYGEADDAKSELEEKISDLVTEFNEKYLAPLNEKIEEARGFVEDIKNERQEEFDDKSERWQEGERGEAAQEWLQSWENAESELSEISNVEPPDLGA